MYSVDVLADELGYSASPWWVAGHSSIPSTAHLFRAARRAHVVGTYVFPTSPAEHPILAPRPALHIAKANTPNEARNIHRSLWNLGEVPFVMVVLPDHVRIYSGFSFDRKHDRPLLSTRPGAGLDLLLAALRDFKAVEIDSGNIWETWGSELRLNGRVDRQLLQDLQQLALILVEHMGLTREVAHSLIGKYTYFHYLRDRGILSNGWLAERGIDPDAVFGRAATMAGFSRLVTALESRFNGQVFPLPLEGESAPEDHHITYVASVFSGDSPVGQLSLDFAVYDFSFIPVELLSSIYEQFLAVDGRGEAHGAVYTPEPLAEYLISEIDSIKRLQLRFRILDPCCGSGVFLVLAYRRLIELKLASDPVRDRLRPSELRDILEQSIYGVERDLEACYVAEFSLILTLLSYLDPADLHRYETFRFPELHNKQIFQADFFKDGSPFWERGLKFDWIIGNPPWISLKPAVEEHRVAREWIDAHPHYHIARYRIHEAFSWRVMDALGADGQVGLVLQATTLTNPQSADFRREFFRQHEVPKVTNFANLAYILFDGRAQVAAAILIYGRVSGDDRGPTVHYGPFVANQIPVRGQRSKRSWSITIYESDIKTVEYAKAAAGDGHVWKMALWGTYRDERAIRQLHRLIPRSLGELAEKRGWIMSVGLMLRLNGTQEEDALESLAGVPLLDTKKLSRARPRYSVPVTCLVGNDRFYIRQRGGTKGLGIIRGPHLVFGVDSAAFSNLDFILPHPQPGLSAPPEDADYLKAISLYLSSDVGRYLAFFESSTWGIERSTKALDHVAEVRVPEFTAEALQELATLHSRLADLEHGGFGYIDELRSEVDNRLTEILQIPNSTRILIKDFSEIRLQFNKGKVGKNAARPPSRHALLEYGRTLGETLERFSGRRHRITLQRSSRFIACEVAPLGGESTEPVLIEDVVDRGLQDLWSSIREQRASWVYVQRSARMFVGNRVFFVKGARLADWTQTQALHDSDDVIAEVLSTGSTAS